MKIYVKMKNSLDTWFSSALWPFSTMNWLENSEDFKRFYPTRECYVYGLWYYFLLGGKEWFFQVEQTGKIPFSDVVLHGMVRDEHGRKMSKSLGNGIDPLEMIDSMGQINYVILLWIKWPWAMTCEWKSEKVEICGVFNNKNMECF